MRLVDLTHPWNLHTPGWVGYPGAKVCYTQTLQTNRMLSQRIETSLHTGTHLDGPMHGTDGTRCVIGAFPWKLEGGEACPCRIVALLDVPGNDVTEVQGAL